MANRRRGRWSEEDIRFLAENAGYMRVSDIAKSIGRSANAVSVMASRLRADGEITTSLRVYSERKAECPECHEMRFRFHGDICEVCHQRRHVEEYRAKVEDMMDGLPRSVTDGMAHDIASKPVPKPPRRPVASDYEAKTFNSYAFERDIERYEEQMEKRELKAISREWDALRRRMARLRKK